MKKTTSSQSPTVRPPQGLQTRPATSAGSRTKAGTPARLRKANAAAGRKSSAAAAKPHPVSVDHLPEAWRLLGLNPDDYADLPPRLANALLPISKTVGQCAWPQLWRIARKLGIEAKLPALCAKFYHKLQWVLEGEDETLAVFEDMCYRTVTGLHLGTVELVRIGYRPGTSPGRLGLRAVLYNATLDRWDVIDPWDRDSQEEQVCFEWQR